MKSISLSDCPVEGSCELGNRFGRKYTEKNDSKILRLGIYNEAHIETQIGLIQFSLILQFHMETSHWIYTANQITEFYMKCNTGLKGKA